jgi:hypothetical protein
LAAEFLSLCGIASAMAALAGFGISGHLPAASERAVAYSVAILIAFLGVAGGYRSIRMHLQIQSEALKIRSITRTTIVPLNEIAYCDFGRTVFGMSLFVAPEDGAAYFARSISYGTKPGSREVAYALREEIMRAIEANQGSPLDHGPDRLSDEPGTPFELALSPPDGATFVQIDARPVVRLVVRSLLATSLALVLVAVGFQAAVPQTFPWIVVAAVGYVVVLAGLPALIRRRAIAQALREGVAFDAETISIRVKGGWKILNLNQLQTVELVRRAQTIGIFGPVVTMTRVVLVDSIGHRLHLEETSLTNALRNHLRSHMRTDIDISPIAANLLEMSQSM